MRVQSVLALALGAVALLGPAAPSHAAGMRPCDEPGHVGYIVYGGDGDIFGICFRTGVVTDPVNEVLGRVQDYRGEVDYWIADVRDTRCWSTPEFIVCDEVPPPPLPDPLP